MGTINTVLPVAAGAPVVNQTTPATQQPTPEQVQAAGENIIINEVNNVSLLSGSSVEILNQIQTAPGENLTLNVTNNITAGSGSGSAGLNIQPGETVQQIEQAVGAYVLKEVEKALGAYTKTASLTGTTTNQQASTSNNSLVSTIV